MFTFMLLYSLSFVAFYPAGSMLLMQNIAGIIERNQQINAIEIEI